MRIQEFHQKQEGEIRRELAGKREFLRRARFELSAGRVKNIRAVRGTRRDIARMLTLLRERSGSRKAED